MPRKTTYAELLDGKQRELLLTSVIQALREGTSLDTTLQQFITGVTKTSAVKMVASDITLGQIFDGLRQSAAPVSRPSLGRPVGRPVGRPPKSAGPKTKKATTTRRVPRAGKRKRADADTVAKRLNAIHKVLKDNGDWMRTGALLEQVSKQKLFTGVVSNTLSQYLAKFAQEKPKRVKKKGQRAASVYRAA